MPTRAQRNRKTARDKRKRWDMIVSSLSSRLDSDSLSILAIQKVVEVAHDLNLGIIGLVGLEALKVGDKDREIERISRVCDSLEEEVLEAHMELRQAQETIAKMNVRYVRRGSKKAKVQHPEKRR